MISFSILKLNLLIEMLKISSYIITYHINTYLICQRYFIIYKTSCILQNILVLEFYLEFLLFHVSEMN